METGAKIPKLTFATEETGQVHLKPQYFRAYQKHQASAATSIAESDDSRALTSSHGSNAREICARSTVPKKKRHSPSPDPPVLLPDEEITNANSEQNGTDVSLDEEGKDTSATPNQWTSRLLAAGSSYPHGESELLHSQHQLILPPAASRALQFGGHSQPISTSEVTCSVQASGLVVGPPSATSLSHFATSQPVFTAAQSPSAPPPNVVVPSTSYQAPSACNKTPMEPNTSKHTGSFHPNESLWNEGCAPGRLPVTMWTPRNEPLPPPDPPHAQTMTSSTNGALFIQSFFPNSCIYTDGINSGMHLIDFSTMCRARSEAPSAYHLYHHQHDHPPAGLSQCHGHELNRTDFRCNCSTTPAVCDSPLQPLSIFSMSPNYPTHPFLACPPAPPCPTEPL